MSKEKANERINSQISSKKEKKLHIAIIATTVVAVCVLTGVILFLVFGKDSEPEQDINRVVTSENVDEIVAQMDESEGTSIGSYEVTMTSDWEFENGKAISKNAYVENSTANKNTVYFTIQLKDDEREIYKSPYLPVGSKLENIKLDKSLKAGVYDTVLTYHLLDENKKEESSVSLALTITIQK